MAKWALLTPAALLGVGLAPAAPLAAQGICRLCYSAPGTQPGEPPLTIEISADIVFSRMALTGHGGGAAVVDPAGGGHPEGGGVVDLGGEAVSGHGRISGAPGREVRVDLPGRVAMTAPGGGSAELTQFKTDLPPHPRLDPAGHLEFSFGARMVVHGDAGGDYRGQIPISVDYN